MKPFKIYAAFAALGALTLASFSATASPDTPAVKNTESSDAKRTANSKVSDWDKYRMTANRGSIGQALATRALSYRGVRYRMGGTSTNGIDCSGLTQTVYKKWGMLIPRTSTEQFKKGRPVPKDQLKAGDLVFFKNTYKQGISHVGIYVGEGKFVHAAGSGKGVIVSGLSEAYHLNHWAGARRIALEPDPVKQEDETGTE